MISTFYSWLLFACVVLDPVRSQTSIPPVCKRWDHQTTIIDDVLYIDGGQYEENKTDRSIKPNNQVLMLNLSEPIPDLKKLPLKAINKPSTIDSTYRGTLWNDFKAKKFYHFGGISSNPTFTFNANSTASFWAFNTEEIAGDSSNPFDRISPPDDVPKIRILTNGTGVTVQSLNLGFYYGGEAGHFEGTSYTYVRDFVTSSMIVYNITDNSWRNETVTAFPPVLNARMEYIPFGKMGSLVLIGGVAERPVRSGVDGTQLLDHVWIYDIDGKSWHQQNVTGVGVGATRPEMRERFCTTKVLSSEDDSSHQIYMFGGTNLANNYYVDDLWALSIPSFQFIPILDLWWSNATMGIDSSIDGHSCDVYGQRQMIITGGRIVEWDECYKTDQGIQIFDLTNEEFKTSFDPALQGYGVPSAVSAVIGGGSNGKATVREPDDTIGWNSPEVEALFKEKPMFTDPSNIIDPVVEEKSTNSKLSRGAVVGIAVGGAILVALIVIGIFVWRKYFKRDMPIAPGPPGPFELGVNDDDDGVVSERVRVRKPMEMAAEVPVELVGSPGFYPPMLSSVDYPDTISSTPTTAVHGTIHVLPPDTKVQYSNYETMSAEDARFMQGPQSPRSPTSPLSRFRQ